MKKVVKEFILGHLFFKLQVIKTMLSQNEIKTAIKEIESLENSLNELSIDMSKK